MVKRGRIDHVKMQHVTPVRADDHWEDMLEFDEL